MQLPGRLSAYIPIKMKRLIYIILSVATLFACKPREVIVTSVEKVRYDSLIHSIDTVRVPIVVDGDTLTLTGEIFAYQDSLKRCRIASISGMTSSNRMSLLYKIWNGGFEITAITNPYRDTIEMLRDSITKISYERTDSVSVEGVPPGKKTAAGWSGFIVAVVSFSVFMIVWALWPRIRQFIFKI